MLELKNIKKSYDGVTVLKNIDLTISDGEIVSILGPSGCGKTTLLNRRCETFSVNYVTERFFYDKI